MSNVKVWGVEQRSCCFSVHRADSARCVVFAGEAEEDLQRLEHIGTGAILCVAHATSLLKVSGTSGHWQKMY